MTNILKNTAAVITLTAVMAATASAAVSKGELTRSVRSALSSSGSIIVHEKNGVVTLSGFYNNASDQEAAIKAVESVDGVDRVVNNAFAYIN